jgi:quercetin dioxygenase-like cupin family protein
MEDVKVNKATPQRPFDRVIDAPHVTIDLDFYVKELKNEEAWKKYDRNGITVFKSEQVAMVLTILKKGADIVDNTVDGFLTIQVLEGKVKIFTLNGETIEAGANQIVSFHPNVYSSIEALSEAAILLTNHTV